MKPLVGITSYFVDRNELGTGRVRGIKDQSMVMSTEDYSRSVLAAGGIPMIIPALLDEEYAKNIINKVDGLLLSGGGDVHPKHYMQAIKKGLSRVEPRRDEFELMLIKHAVDKNIPIMGICRGFQLLNVYFGGTLIQDINTYLNTCVEHVGVMLERNDTAHSVSIEKGSELYSCLKAERISVNSFHHQVVDVLSSELYGTAYSEDGFVEAFEHISNKLIFAVQWHPEMMSEADLNQQNLFQYFINKIKGGA